jgi:staphylococcal nuclease domain-containing protein 1
LFYAQPWAFQSREFLRRKAIGQPVAFRITFTGNGNRRYGQVFLDTRDLREDIIANGWAKVMPEKNGELSRNKTILHLQELEKKAKDEGRGMHNKDSKLAARSVRNILHNYDAFDVFEKLKGKHLNAVVDQVRTGSTLRVYLPETGHMLLVLLSGVQAPLYSYNNAEDEQDPHAREARFYSELHSLHRDSTLVLEGLDKAKNFLGTLIVNGKNLSVSLLSEGLARFVEWSAQKVSNIQELRAAEESAKAKTLRLWSVPKTPQQLAAEAAKKEANKKGGSKTDFVGRVIEIVNAGTVSVLDEKSGEEIKLALSSIAPARLIPREKLKDSDVSEEEKFDAAFAWEAKEFLRKKLIGTKVRCVQDYVRPAKDGLPEKPFWSVYHEKKNVSLELVERGLAKVIDHRGGNNDRSPDYEELVMAEHKAQKKNAGLFSSRAKRPVFHFQDLFNMEDVPAEEESEEAADADAPKKSRGKRAELERLQQAHVARLQLHLPHLQRAGRTTAVVERVLGGSRFKLWIEKETCMIPFVLHSIRTEKAVPGKEPVEYDAEHRKRVTQFAREQLYQRDVEVVIDSVDKRGNYVGALYVNGKKDFGLTLVEQAYASVFHPTASKSKLISYKEYQVAEDSAKAARRGIWVDYDEEAERERREAFYAKRAEERGEKANAKSKVDILNVSLTEILDGSTFFYQIVSDEQTALDQLMKDFNALDFDSKPAGAKPAVDDLVAAKFTDDDIWYRAKVVAVNGNEYTVNYIDYGNKEVIGAERIRPMDSAFGLNTLPPQAHEGRLAYVKTPSVNDDFGRDAAAFLKEMAWDKVMVANVQWREGNVAYLVLGDPETQVHINAAMLRAGLATMPRGSGPRGGSPLVCFLFLLPDFS